MTPVANSDLREGMIVVMTQAGADFPGLRNRLFEILVIDIPYVVIRTTGAASTTHMVLLDEVAFSMPEAKTIAAISPSSYWPETIGE